MSFPKTMMAYNFMQENDDETVIDIFDVISSEKSVRYDWENQKYVEGKEVTPNDFEEKLKAVTTNNITIRMNSLGGEVVSANVIAVAIEEAVRNGKNIVCKIVGMCASAAVQIAIACSKVVAHESALIMIHNPMVLMFGYYSVNDFSKVENMLTATKNSILNHYIKKTGLSKQKLSNMMDAETYMDGREAMEKGFVDELMFEEKTEDVINRVQTIVNQCDFLHVPDKYRSMAVNIIPTPKEGEPKEMEIRTVDELTAQYPELVNQIRTDAVAEARNSAVNEGVEMERARMQAIDEMSGRVSPELLNRAKYETFATAENVAMEAIKTGAFIQTQVLNAMQTETQPANNVAGAVNNGVTDPVVDEKKAETEKASATALNYLKKIGKVKED